MKTTKWMFRLFFSVGTAAVLTACYLPKGNLPVPITTLPPVTATVETPAPLPETGVDPTTAPTTASGSATAKPQPSVQPRPGEDIAQMLAQAVEAKDPTAMRSLMGNRFSISVFKQTLFEYPSDEALQKLLDDQFGPGSTPAVRFGTDVTALLSGADPLGQWGPVADPVQALHVMGLGSKAAEEAVLVIARSPEGRFYWHGILLPEGGYFQSSSDTPTVLQTDVKFVAALDDVNVRKGPGQLFNVIGLVREGQIAQVTGRSADSGWWRINCTQDSAGNCWISADPTLTEPTTAP